MLINPRQEDNQNGRLCGHYTPQPGNTSSNGLFVQFRSDASGQGRGFKLLYRQLSFGCGGHVQLTDLNPEFDLTTPDYPRTPPAHSECVWTISAPRGKRVQLDFTERFDLVTSTE